MSNAQRPAPEAEGGANETPAATTSLGVPAWKRLLGRSWVIVLVVVLIGLQFAAFGYLRRAASVMPKTPEITLGEFQFEHQGDMTASIAGARFALHIGLLPEVDTDSRLRLAARRFKVQQDVEELLRRAHSADFEDPSLSELKRQLQEQINTSLGIRGVSEIIITDLTLRRGTPVATADAHQLLTAPVAPEQASSEPSASPATEAAPL